MELDNIKSRTTWNDASASINSNFMKVRQAIVSLQEGGNSDGIDPDELDDILDAKGYATEGYVNGEVEKVKTDIKTKPSTYVPLKTINGLSLYGSGNINVEGGSGGGSEGLTAINVNDESFQPDENGIVTLPDYPIVPTFPSFLPNPYQLRIGDKRYNGSASVTILEDDVVEDIEDIRTKVASLENYDDAEVKADIATLEGYFTNGKAKNADKLDGQDSTYFATAQSVSSLSVNVTNVTNDVSVLKPKVASNEGDIATLKEKMRDAENSIATQGNDIASLKNSMAGAEEDIADNANGIKENAEDISDLDGRLESIESWYNNVGIKFSKDADGTIMMDGDFYTTGENSAGGVGESVGGTGGIDEDEVIEIVNGMGLASKEDLKDKQDKLVSGSNIKTINGESILGEGNIVITQSDTPTSPELRTLTIGDKEYNGSEEVTISEDDIITDIEAIRTNASLGATALQSVPSEYVTEGELNQALGGKVDTEDGKGLSDNNYTDTDKAKLDSLKNYDDTELKQKVNEVAEDVQAFDGRISDLEDWYDRVGRKIDYDAEEGAVKVEGDFYTTGENSAGGAGEAVGGTGGGITPDDLDDILKGYATETWVNQQGFATSEDIPQKVSELDNDSGFITKTIADGRYASAEDFNDLEDRVQSIEDGGGTGSGDIDLSDYATKQFVNDGLAKKVDKVDGMGLSENNYSDAEKSKLESLVNYDDTDINDRLSDLEDWFEEVGSKFSKESDGTIKMTGDFFTTGENSAGGLGESVGSTGGGLDESELEDYLTDNKYAKQSWVTSQGYAKGTIPTKVSELDNDAGYVTAADIPQVPTLMSQLKNDAGYATTSDLDKKVDKVDGMGLSENNYTDEDKNTLANMSGRVDNAENAVNAMSGIVETLNDKVATIEEWYNRVSDKIDYDIDEDAIVVTGDLHATGENSAGGLGEDIGEWGDIVSRLTTLENRIGNIPSQITELATKVAALESSVGMQNVEIKVASIITKGTISRADMESFGLTVAIADKMLQGAYNKVLDTSGTYPVAWEYTAERPTTSTIMVYLRKGADNYKFAYNVSTTTWTINKI